MNSDTSASAQTGIALIGLNGLGRIDLWNPAAEALLGWSEEEVLGKEPPFPLELPFAISEDPAPASQDIKARDGRIVSVRLAATPRGEGGGVFVVTDLSHAATEERFRELLEAAPDAIIEVDADGRIVLLNRVTEELFGYTRDQLLGRNVDSLLPFDLAAMHAAHRARYLAHPVRRPMGHGYVLKARRSDGTELPVEISLSPVRVGNTVRVMAIIRDVSARRKAEEAIRIANHQLELRSREAERANALKSEFLASMSHELRTPLHTILGFAELLREQTAGPLNEKQKRFIQHVHQDSTHLLDLINDILDLSKIEAGKMDLQIESIDAAEVIAETVDGMRARAVAKNILLENSAAAPLRVMADRVRFREVLLNLLSNAVKFTPDGGVVSIDASRPTDGLVEIAVSDSGIGIAPDDQEVVFEKFRQIGSTTKGVREGTGLGLAIVKQLVQMQGGETSLRSALGEGSRFAFTIPADASRVGAAPLVLIVEDSANARELLCSYLDPIGIRTECAASAEEGLLKAQRLLPDAIMLDLLLPERTGWRVLEDLRAAPETRDIPVFVTSVLDFDRGATTRGATGYLQKPLKKDAVIRALREQVPSRFGNI